MTSIVGEHLNPKRMNGACLYIHHTAEECGRGVFSEVHVPDKLLLACITGSGAAYVIMNFVPDNQIWQCAVILRNTHIMS